jgi:hypothetical protein
MNETETLRRCRTALARIEAARDAETADAELVALQGPLRRMVSAITRCVEPPPGLMGQVLAIIGRSKEGRR